MVYKTLKSRGRTKISIKDGKLQVPDNPIIPFVEGMARVATFGAPRCVCSMRPLRRLIRAGARSIGWKFTRAKRPSNCTTHGCRTRLPKPSRNSWWDQRPAHNPDRRRHPFLECCASQIARLYVCQRPVRWYTGVPSPVKHPEYVDMSSSARTRGYLYRYRVPVWTEDNTKFMKSFKEAFPKEYAKMRFPDTAAIASNRSPSKGPNVWCAPPFNGR